MLADCMTKRHESGITNTSSDSDDDGILKTLQAITSQTEKFDWSELAQGIETKLRAAIPEYQFNPDNYRIEPALLLGAIEAFHKVQSLPEDRKVLVTNRVGAVVLTVWAHAVLGLHVIISSSESYTSAHPIAHFPTDSPPQVIIHWDDIGSYGDTSGQAPMYPKDSGASGPEIRLLDSEGSVILRSFPESSVYDTFEAQTESRLIQAQDRHTLQGWGTLYMRRALNTYILISEDNAIHEEIVKHVTALAMFFVREVARFTNCSPQSFAEPLSGEAQRLAKAFKTPTGLWRVVAAANLIFEGVTIDIQGVESYLEFLDLGKTVKMGITCASEDLPGAYASYMKRVEASNPGKDVTQGMRLLLDHLTHVLIVTAHIADINACKKLPILVDNQRRGFVHVHPRIAGWLGERAMFQAALCLFADNRTVKQHAVTGKGEDLRFLWLSSDYGWSAYYDTADDKDPTEVTPELIHIERGVPTHTSTGERRSTISDTRIRDLACPRLSTAFPLIKGERYSPQASTRTRKRQPLWERRPDGFEMLLRFNFEHVPYKGKETLHAQTLEAFEKNDTGMHDHCNNFYDYSGYCECLTLRWSSLVTPDDICAHESAAPGESIYVSLGPDAVVAAGYCALLDDEWPPHKVIVHQTLADKGLRWLTLKHCMQDKGAKGRHVMIRHPRCCPKCAFQHTASLPGKWSLLL